MLDTDRFPTVADAVFATVVPSPNGQAATLYWARSVHHGVPLVLLDWDVSLLTSAEWQKIDERIDVLRTRCRARAGSLGLWVEGEAVAQHAAARVAAAKPVPAHLTTAEYWPSLALVAGNYVDDGAVKLTKPAAAKMRTNPFGALPRRAPGPRGDDATVPAWLYGIVLGLDETAANPPDPARVKVVNG